MTHLHTSSSDRWPQRFSILCTTRNFHHCVKALRSTSMMRSSSAESAEGLLPRKDEAGPSTSQTFRDPESLEDVPLVPGLNKLDNMLRWGFIKKVYGIISAQMVLTVVVASIIIFNEPVGHFVTTSAPFQISVFAFSFLGLIPLYFYQRKHPLNLILLGVWTALLSVSIGTTCTFYQPLVVLEALALTAAIVLALTVYTFNAARKGANFSFLGPMLFGCLMALIVWSIFQIFLPPGPVQNTIFSLLGSILFSAYIVYDTDNLIQRFDLDQYIWASVTLYLDIINLFLKILQLLNGRRD